METREIQKEQRYKAILEAALDLFIRKGYSATKITDIAKAANMSNGLLFHYFKSKEDLYIELVTLGIQGPKQMLNAIPADLEALKFFTLCAEKTLKFAKASKFTAKMFILMGTAYYNEGTPKQAQEIAAQINFYRDTTPIIIKGQKAKTIRSGDPLCLTTTFWSALQGVIQVYALDKLDTLPEAEWFVDMIKAK